MANEKIFGELKSDVALYGDVTKSRIVTPSPDELKSLFEAKPVGPETIPFVYTPSRGRVSLGSRKNRGRLLPLGRRARVVTRGWKRLGEQLEKMPMKAYGAKTFGLYDFLMAKAG